MMAGVRINCCFCIGFFGMDNWQVNLHVQTELSNLEVELPVVQHTKAMAHE